jgi:hypothetical protein
VLREFSENENFVPLSRNVRLIDYQNAQIIMIGAREGRDIIKNEIGIEIEEHRNKGADIFTELKLQKDKTPIKPLIEGRLE